MSDKHNNRFTIRLSDLKTMKKLDELNLQTGISKSKLINMLISNYIDDFANTLSTMSRQKNDGEKTHKLESFDFDNQLKYSTDQLKYIENQTIMNRVDLLVNQKMISSIYQHLIVMLNVLPDMPKFSTEIKNQFDNNLPVNFSDLKSKIINDLILEDEDTEED